MIIKPAETPEHVKQVLCHPDIYPTISGDGAPPRDEWEVQPNAAYLAGYVDKQPVAIMVFHPKNTICWQIHIHVLPEYRQTHADKFLRGSLAWWWSHSKTVILVAEIPSKYPNVLAFALKHGFQIDGRTDNAYIKDGKLYSMYHLSQERP